MLTNKFNKPGRCHSEIQIFNRFTFLLHVVTSNYLTMNQAYLVLYGFYSNKLFHYLLRMTVLTSTANIKCVDDPANPWENNPNHILIHTQTLQDPLLITWPRIHPSDVLTDWHSHFITTIRVLSLIFVRLILRLCVFIVCWFGSLPWLGVAVFVEF